MSTALFLRRYVEDEDKDTCTRTNVCVLCCVTSLDTQVRSILLPVGMVNGQHFHVFNILMANGSHHHLLSQLRCSITLNTIPVAHHTLRLRLSGQKSPVKSPL